MDYYTQSIFIPQVNEYDEVIGKVERWEAHEKGILHRGFTVGLKYQDAFICQHRKHPVFDGFLDLTASSHPLFMEEKPQSVEDATYSTLKREWNLSQDKIKNLKMIGKVLYNSRFGKYIEHEMCYLLTGEVDELPQVNYEFAYGFSLLSAENLKSTDTPIGKILAPWVTQFVKEELL